jgi:DNA-binding CsgD family transcriptional regulator
MERTLRVMSEAGRYFELAGQCCRCESESRFRELVSELVEPLLRHRSLVAVIGRVDLDHLDIQRIVGINHPPAHLASLNTTIALRERRVVAHWLRTSAPLVLRLPEDRSMMSDHEAYEIESHQLGRLGICGVLDADARTGTYLSFAGLPEQREVDAQVRMLGLLAPPLCQALVRVHRMSSARARPERSLLSRAERELLRWVVAGRTNGDIAQLRSRSSATVRNQLHSAYQKLGVAGRAEAIRLLLATPRMLDTGDD